MICLFVGGYADGRRIAIDNPRTCSTFYIPEELFPLTVYNMDSPPPTDAHIKTHTYHRISLGLLGKLRFIYVDDIDTFADKLIENYSVTTKQGT